MQPCDPTLVYSVQIHNRPGYGGQRQSGALDNGYSRRSCYNDDNNHSTLKHSQRHTISSLQFTVCNRTKVRAPLSLWSCKGGGDVTSDSFTFSCSCNGDNWLINGLVGLVVSILVQQATSIRSYRFLGTSLRAPFENLKKGSSSFSSAYDHLAMRAHSHSSSSARSRHKI